MSDAATLALARMQTALADCRAYRASEQSKHLASLLDALAESYRIELESVSPDGLARVQAALAQTRALRAALTDEIGELPKI